MYNNNSYMGGSYYTPYTQGYQVYQNNNIAQRQIPQQPQDIPFTVVRFGTLDEAKAHIVPPTKAVLFIKSDFTELYVKSADNMGNPTLETFKCSRLTENPTEMETPKFDPKEFVKSSDLKGFVTFDDLKSINLKLDQLQKQIQINDILKGGIVDERQEK